MKLYNSVIPALVVGLLGLAVLGTIALTQRSDSASGQTEPVLYSEDFKGEFGKPGYRFDDPDVELELTASVGEWEVAPGEIVEAWMYNGTYPGPEIRLKVGQKVRVTLHNDLPDATSVHWHGLDVPNPEDGVGTVTQPLVNPGESWTYEFIPNHKATSVYHTHSHTLDQISKGLFGALIVEGADEPEYDQDKMLLLHEIGGFYTINGHSYPLTLEEDQLTVETGDTIRIRMANMGGMSHPMHLHGHQFEVLSIDGNTMPAKWLQNTIDVPPGQTVDVVVNADNPGTWTFHCHVISHVANKGVYPGGMLTLLDYSDHTSYFDEQIESGVNPYEMHANHDSGTPSADPDAGGGEAASADIEIASVNSLFDAHTLVGPANTEVTVAFDNQDAGVPHNISFYTDSSANEEIYVGEIFAGVEERTFTFTTPDPGEYFFRCDVHPSTMVGELIVE